MSWFVHGDKCSNTHWTHTQSSVCLRIYRHEFTPTGPAIHSIAIRCTLVITSQTKCFRAVTAFWCTMNRMFWSPSLSIPGDLKTLGKSAVSTRCRTRGSAVYIGGPSEVQNESAFLWAGKACCRVSEGNTHKTIACKFTVKLLHQVHASDVASCGFV